MTGSSVFMDHSGEAIASIFRRFFLRGSCLGSFFGKLLDMDVKDQNGGRCHCRYPLGVADCFGPVFFQRFGRLSGQTGDAFETNAFGDLFSVAFLDAGDFHFLFLDVSFILDFGFDMADVFFGETAGTVEKRNDVLKVDLRFFEQALDGDG